MSSTEPILTVHDLETAFFTEKETIRAVDGVSFDVTPGETVGIVGESGSGKSVTARSIMRLIKSPGAILDGSSIRFHHLETVREFADRFPGRTVDLTTIESVRRPDGGSEHPSQRVAPTIIDRIRKGAETELQFLDAEACVFVTAGNADEPASIDAGFIDITRTSGPATRAMRGGRIAMIFQDPLSSLNPVYSVGNQIKEALRLHQGLRGRAASRKAIELLEDVGISDARRRVKEYPHEFSGGMRQRAMIAMALACDPEVLICDEPTTALDVTIQAQILDLLADLQAQRDLAIIFITHDMGVIANVADRVNVMYAGEIVESTDVVSLFEAPRHPYTVGLMESIPGAQAGDRLSSIPGTVPTPTQPPTYCRFVERCPKAFDACDRIHPASLPVNDDVPDHRARCLLYPEDVDEATALARHEEEPQ